MSLVSVASPRAHRTEDADRDGAAGVGDLEDLTTAPTQIADHGYGHGDKDRCPTCQPPANRQRVCSSASDIEGRVRPDALRWRPVEMYFNSESVF